MRKEPLRLERKLCRYASTMAIHSAESFSLSLSALKILHSVSLISQAHCTALSSFVHYLNCRFEYSELFARRFSAIPFRHAANQLSAFSLSAFTLFA